SRLNASLRGPDRPVPKLLTRKASAGEYSQNVPKGLINDRGTKAMRRAQGSTTNIETSGLLRTTRDGLRMNGRVIPAYRTKSRTLKVSKCVTWWTCMAANFSGR